MPLYDYKIAKTVLSEKDKERFTCLFLATRADGTVDWDKATADFDCASVSSMKTMFYGALKKIEKAGGKLGGGNATSATLTSTPASTTPKKTRGKKRKTTPVVGDDDDEEATPTTKKQRRKTDTDASGWKFAANASDIKAEPVGEGEEETTS